MVLVIMMSECAGDGERVKRKGRPWPRGSERRLQRRAKGGKGGSAGDPVRCPPHKCSAQLGRLSGFHGEGRKVATRHGCRIWGYKGACKEVSDVIVEVAIRGADVG